MERGRLEMSGKEAIGDNVEGKRRGDDNTGRVGGIEDKLPLTRSGAKLVAYIGDTWRKGMRG
ncbi:hypothetical protein M1N50_01515 [Dehalococcoidia bacterium]|nr:hypothetical protein [Dehalococcoidia bacterium]